MLHYRCLTVMLKTMLEGLEQFFAKTFKILNKES